MLKSLTTTVSSPVFGSTIYTLELYTRWSELRSRSAVALVFDYQTRGRSMNDSVLSFFAMMPFGKLSCFPHVYPQ